MTTDTMRERFERDYRSAPRASIDQSKKDLAWFWFSRGHHQGQRDLINSMHVVGYRYYVDKMDYWELVEEPVAHRMCYPVYFLPEDTPK